MVAPPGGRMLGSIAAGLLLLATVSGVVRPVGAAQGPTPTPIPGVIKPAVPWQAGPVALPAAEGGFAVGPREGALPRTGLIEVAVELSDPPAARVYALAKTGLHLSEAVASALARDYARRLEAAQNTLIVTLTTPPINATVLGRTQWTLNSILIRIDAAQVDAVRQLPGVLAVRPLRLGQLTNGTPIPGSLSPAKPIPAAPVAPGRPDGAQVY